MNQSQIEFHNYNKLWKKHLSQEEIDFIIANRAIVDGKEYIAHGKTHDIYFYHEYHIGTTNPYGNPWDHPLILRVLKYAAVADTYYTKDTDDEKGTYEVDHVHSHRNNWIITSPSDYQKLRDAIEGRLNLYPEYAPIYDVNGYAWAGFDYPEYVMLDREGNKVYLIGIRSYEDDKFAVIGYGTNWADYEFNYTTDEDVEETHRWMLEKWEEYIPQRKYDKRDDKKVWHAVFGANFTYIKEMYGWREDED